MSQPRDIQIKGNVPFLKAKMVLLVENPSNPISVPYSFYWEKKAYRLRREGYNFISLSGLLVGIVPQISDYVFPGYEVPDITATYQRICNLAGIGRRNGLLYKIGRTSYFKDLSDVGTDLDASIWSLIDDIQERRQTRIRKAKDSEIRFSVVSDAKIMDLNEDQMCEIPFEPDSFRFSVINESEEDLDERTICILADVQCLLKNHHLSLDELRVILGYRIKLSRMKITRNGRILLTDFLDKETGQPKEVKMHPLTKMLYLFYLKHPEGIRIKEVSGYIYELMHLYMGITGRDDKDAIRTSIINHIDPFGNDINVSMSRIKSAFKDVMDASVAKYYWVEGKGGDPYRIAIDRDKVLWEYGD